MTYHAVKEAGIGVAAPTGWKAVDIATIKNNPAAMKEISKYTGMPVAVLAAGADQNKVLFMNTRSGNNAENLSISMTALPLLPPADLLKQSLSGPSVTVNGSEEITTPVGDGIAIEFSAKSPNGAVRSVGAFVDTGSGVVSISSTASASDPTVLLDKVTSGLRKTS